MLCRELFRIERLRPPVQAAWQRRTHRSPSVLSASPAPGTAWTVFLRSWRRGRKWTCAS